MAVEVRTTSVTYKGTPVTCKVQVDIPNYPIYAYNPKERYIMVMWCSGDSSVLGSAVKDRVFRQKVEKELKRHYRMPARFPMAAIPKTLDDWLLRF